MSQCISCGFEAGDAKAYCGNCGSPRVGAQSLAGDSADETADVVAANKPRSFKWVLLSLPLIILTAGAVWLSSGMFDLEDAGQTTVESLKPSEFSPANESTPKPSALATAPTKAALLPAACPSAELFTDYNGDAEYPLQVGEAATATQLDCRYYFDGGEGGFDVTYRTVPESDWKAALGGLLSQGYNAFTTKDGKLAYELVTFGYEPFSKQKYSVSEYLFYISGVEIKTMVSNPSWPTLFSALQW